METWTLTGAHVDWITATYTRGPLIAEFMTLGCKILETEKLNGNPSHPANFNGYHGSSSLHAFVGYRKDGACIRLGGRASRLGWRSVAQRATNVTRLDIAITTTVDPVRDNVALELWNGVALRKNGRLSRADYSCIQSLNSGSSLYCGKRSSATYGRVYDKNAESKGHYPRGTWRWEVEYKPDVVKDLVALLLSRADSTWLLMAHVADRFDDWGITVPWRARSIRHRPIDDRTPSTAESRYNWLKDVVSGTVASLRPYYTSTEILGSLNLINLPYTSAKSEAEQWLRTEIDDLLAAGP